jgi:hypothetical protein
MNTIKNELSAVTDAVTSKDATIEQLKEFEKNKVNAISSLLEKLQANSKDLPVADAEMIEKLKAVSKTALENVDTKIEEHLAFLKPIQIS